MIRSRIQWIDEGERLTKYFCALETKFFLDKTIKKVLTINNEIITDQKPILNALQTYYAELFKNRDAELKHRNIKDQLKDENLKKLTENQKKVLKEN